MNKYRKYLPAVISTTGTSEKEVDDLAYAAYQFAKKWDLNFQDVE